MDQAATFVLRTYIHSRASVEKMIKVLYEIEGVDEIFIAPNGSGDITILGTVDPQQVMKTLRENDINSQLMCGPMINRRDLPNVPRSKSPSPVENVDISIDMSRDRIKITCKTAGKKEHQDGKSGSASERNLDENATNKKGKKGKHVMNSNSNFHGTQECYCSISQGTIGCGGTNCRYMAPPYQSTPVFSSPGASPSAPPEPQPPCDNPAGFIVFFLLFILVLVIQAALS